LLRLGRIEHPYSQRKQPYSKSGSEAYVTQREATLTEDERVEYAANTKYAQELRAQAETLVPPDLWNTAGCNLYTAAKPGQRPRWVLTAPRDDFEVIVRSDDPGTCTISLPVWAWPTVPGPQPARKVSATSVAITEALVRMLGEHAFARRMQAHTEG
jgi:hypothetical protein